MTKESVRIFTDDDVKTAQRDAKQIVRNNPILDLSKLSDGGEVLGKFLPMRGYNNPAKKPVFYVPIIEIWVDFGKLGKKVLLSKRSFGETCQIQSFLDQVIAKVPALAAKCKIETEMNTPLNKNGRYIFPFLEFREDVDSDGVVTVRETGVKMLSCTSKGESAIMAYIKNKSIKNQTPNKIGAIDKEGVLVSISRDGLGSDTKYICMPTQNKYVSPCATFDEYENESTDVFTYFKEMCQSDKYTKAVLTAYLKNETPPEGDIWKIEEQMTQNAAKPALPSAKSPMSDITNWQKVDSEPPVESKGDLPF